MAETIKSGTDSDDDAVFDRVFTLSQELGYKARVRALTAAEPVNVGESALIVDPSESPLWYVNHGTLRLDSKERVKELRQIAEHAIRWTNEVTERQQLEAAEGLQSGGGNGAVESSSSLTPAPSRRVFFWRRRT